MNSREKKMSDAFFVLGSQYYAIGHYFSQKFLLPVPVTLLHHGLEMLLKGYLVRHHSSKELRKIGHDLSSLWKLFRSHIESTDVGRLSSAINGLNEVEVIRYPDPIVDEGYVLNVAKGPVVPPTDIPGAEDLRSLNIELDDLDEAVEAILEASSVNPAAYFGQFPGEVLQMLPPVFRPSAHS